MKSLSLSFRATFRPLYPSPPSHSLNVGSARRILESHTTPDKRRAPKAPGSSGLNDVTTRASSGDEYPTFLLTDANSAAAVAYLEPPCIKANDDIASRKKRHTLSGTPFKLSQAFVYEWETKVSVPTLTLAAIISTCMSLIPTVTYVPPCLCHVFPKELCLEMAQVTLENEDSPMPGYVLHG